MTEHHPRLLDSNRNTGDHSTEATNNFRSELFNGSSDNEWREVSRARSTNTASLPTLEIMTDTIREHYDQFDPNHDGIYGRDELQRLAARQGLDDNTTATVVTMLSNYDEIARTHDDSWNSWWHSMTGQHPVDRTLSTADLENMRGLSDRAVDTFTGASNASSNDHSLFGYNNLVTPEAVQQGMVGNCSLEATLTSMANTEQGQEMIRRMIQTEGENYRVTFPNGQSVVVAPPTDAEMALYAHNVNGAGTWPAVITRAYGALLAQRGWIFNPNRDTPMLATDNCAPFNPFQTMTAGGDQTENLEFRSMTDEQLHERLSELSRNPLAMVADTAGEPDRDPMAASVVKSGGAQETVLSNHAYALEDYDPETMTVYLRNPHHGGTLLAMTLPEFRQQFNDMHAVGADEP